ncbi:MAG: TlyA family RNA methyltransferase [Firmicutes bacterium]|nr:TlyA family RNA methyltransferase [Bacillota bacterium]
MKKRERLDLLLMERYPGISRSRARAEIISGRVLAGGKVCSKPGTLYPRETEIFLQEPVQRYVSRGGFKLAGALADLELTVDGLSVLDVGASTGGFTDCLLQQGARRVIAVDVGYGQLAWTLRRHPQVTVRERCNIRHLRPQDLPWAPDLAVVDLSFISLKLVLPVLKEHRLPAVLALVKPQFEVGRREADRGRGVIRDPRLHCFVLQELTEFACQTGYCTEKMSYSRLPGPRGNLEYFVYWSLPPSGRCACPEKLEEEIGALVSRAWRDLVK